MSKQCVPLLWEVMYCTVEERSFSLLFASVSDFHLERNMEKKTNQSFLFPKAALTNKGKQDLVGIAKTKTSEPFLPTT